MPDKEASAQPAPQPPYVLAVVVCDHVHRDPGTGKCTLLGCFSGIWSRKFPAVHSSMFVYIAVTDGRGNVPLKVRIVDVEEAREPVFDGVLSCDFDDPRMVVEAVFPVQGAVFPMPGEYRIQVFGGADPLMERRIVVQQANGGADEPGH